MLLIRYHSRTHINLLLVFKLSDPALHQPELAPDPAQHRGDHQHHDQEQVVEQHQGHGEPNVEGLSGFQDGEEVGKVDGYQHSLVPKQSKTELAKIK